MIKLALFATSSLVFAVTLIKARTKIKKLEQVADCRAIDGNVGIVEFGSRVG